MTTTRTALVTGGASGLGAATAHRLRAEGLTVVTLDLAAADLTADVTDETALGQLATEIGPVDILVNSAGVVGPNRPLLETTVDEWRRVMEVNVLGTVNTMRAFVPGMRDRGWGRVVNIASMAGKDGNPNLSIYSASKAAVIGLTKSAGKELATTGVLVNVIAPAVIATPMNDDTDPQVLAHITSLRHLTRALTRERLAELATVASREHLAMNPEDAFDAGSIRAAVPTDRTLLRRSVRMRVLGVQPPDPDPFAPYGRSPTEPLPDYRQALAVPMKPTSRRRRLQV
jgi:3-oxoacyl-[acyl-carrier protein] reductase